MLYLDMRASTVPSSVRSLKAWVDVVLELGVALVDGDGILLAGADLLDGLAGVELLGGQLAGNGAVGDYRVALFGLQGTEALGSVLVGDDLGLGEVLLGKGLGGRARLNDVVASALLSFSL